MSFFNINKSNWRKGISDFFAMYFRTVLDANFKTVPYRVILIVCLQVRVSTKKVPFFCFCFLNVKRRIILEQNIEWECMYGISWRHLFLQYFGKPSRLVIESDLVCTEGRFFNPIALSLFTAVKLNRIKSKEKNLK